MAKTSTPSNLPQSSIDTGSIGDFAPMSVAPAQSSLPNQSFPMSVKPAGTPASPAQVPQQAPSAPRQQPLRPTPAVQQPTERKTGLIEPVAATRQAEVSGIAAEQQEVAPATAETTTKVEADGTTTTEKKDYVTPEAQEYKKALDDAMQSISSEIQYAREKFKSIGQSADAAQAALLESINATFQVREQEITN